MVQNDYLFFEIVTKLEAANIGRANDKKITIYLVQKINFNENVSDFSSHKSTL